MLMLPLRHAISHAAIFAITDITPLRR